MNKKLKKESVKLGKIRKNQPKISLKEAQEQAKRLMSTKNKARNRLTPKYYNNEIPYVTYEMIVSFHGEEWAKKWSKQFGDGNTCLLIPKNDKENETGKDTSGIYFWDYENVSDKIDFNKLYIWD